MKPVLDILIPTWNNPEYFDPCVRSIFRTGILNTGLARLIVINNGKQPIKQALDGHPNVLVLEPGDNLGWEGGLSYGLKHSESTFVCFQNDDTHIPFGSNQAFYQRMIVHFADDNVGIVGPVTTVASGIQSIFHPETPQQYSYVRWMIFFCAVVRRKHLDEVGGLDTCLPGGDDFDLSIRMVKAGKKLIVTPESFLIHHGFKTGIRVRGDHTTDGGWNSLTMRDNTNKALIGKHGFKSFFETMSHQVIGVDDPGWDNDREGDIIRSLLKQEDNVLELACGYRKTIQNSIAVDRVPKGEIIPLFNGKMTASVADEVCDVTKDLPFQEESFDILIARHIIEHCIDLVDVLKKWRKVLKPYGKLIIATPDEKIINGIPLSWDHCHAFTTESLRNILELSGFSQTYTQSAGNGISFISVFEKVPKEIMLFTESDFETGFPD